MIEPAGRYRSQTTAGNAGRELFGPHGPGEGVDIFTIPLNYLPPPNLRCYGVSQSRTTGTGGLMRIAWTNSCVISWRTRPFPHYARFGSGDGDFSLN